MTTTIKSKGIANSTLSTGAQEKMTRIFIGLIPYVFVFLWSTGFIAAKYALPFIDPFYLLFIRMALTALVFLFLCMFFRIKRLSLREATHQIVAGLLLHGAYLGGVFAAIKWDMPAGITSIVVGVQPVLTAFLSWCFFSGRLHIWQWIGLCLGFIGITTVLLSSGHQDNITLSLPAMAAAVSALLGITLGTLYQKRFGQNINLLAGAVWQYLGATVLMGAIAWSFESRTVIWDLQLILSLVWLIFGLSVTAILLLMYMIREGETAKVASYFYLVPPLASIEAWFLFDESLSVQSVIAIAVTVLGVYLVIKPRQIENLNHHSAPK